MLFFCAEFRYILKFEIAYTNINKEWYITMAELEFESVHNYYERLVFSEISEKYRNLELDSDQLADVACVALNMIPPRYIRHAIDMSFYSYGTEHDEMEEKAKDAVAKAYDEIKKLDGIK